MKKYYKFLLTAIIGLSIIVIVFSIKNTFAASNIKMKVGDKEITLDNLKDGQLYVGFGKANIDPDLSKGGVPLLGIGSSANRVATLADQSDAQGKLQQSLYATAVAIMDKDKNVVIFITADLCNMSNDTYLSRIKEAASKKTGIPTSRIMFSTTHTHSGPDVGFTNKTEYPKLAEAIETYRTRLYAQVAKASYDALIDLSPATISIGTTNVSYKNGPLNFVRNYKATPKDKDYKITVNRGTGINNYIYVPSKNDPSKKTWITSFDMVSHQTQSDPTLQIIKFERNKKKSVLMINWQVHPVITAATSQKVISSDFVESLRNTLEKDLDCRVAYYTGGAANLNPYTEISSEKNDLTTQVSTARDMKRVSEAYGKKLADHVKSIYDKTKKVSGKYVSLKQETVKLTSRTIADAEATNAAYIQKIYNSSASDIAKMIAGTYAWPSNYKFPVGIDKNGAKLRAVINFSGYLQKVFKLEGNEKAGYKCTVIGTVTSDHKGALIKYIGATFGDYHIHSLTHANVVVSRKSYNGKIRDIGLSAVSLGSISFAMAPYEMFDTNAKYIRNKTKSTSEMTFVMSLTNGKKGYMPSKDTYNYECYENSITYFPKGSAETLAEKLVSLVSAATIQPVTKITVSPTSKEIYVGSTVTLTATIKPSNATDKSVKWESSNPLVATVDDRGKVTALKAGTTTIKATSIDGNKSDTIKLTIEEKEEPIEPTDPDDSVEPDNPTEPKKEENNKENNNILLIVGLSALGVVGVGAGAYVVSKRKKEEPVQNNVDYQNTNNFDNNQQENNMNYQDNNQNNNQNNFPNV